MANKPPEPDTIKKLATIGAGATDNDSFKLEAGNYYIFEILSVDIFPKLASLTVVRSYTQLGVFSQHTTFTGDDFPLVFKTMEWEKGFLVGNEDYYNLGITNGGAAPVDVKVFYRVIKHWIVQPEFLQARRG